MDLRELDDSQGSPEGQGEFLDVAGLGGVRGAATGERQGRRGEAPQLINRPPVDPFSGSGNGSRQDAGTP